MQVSADVMTKSLMGFGEAPYLPPQPSALYILHYLIVEVRGGGQEI